jgi:hypothetical protein
LVGAASVTIPHTVRVSERARHVRLTVSARDGLVVVVPRTWRGDPAAVVDAKAAWALRALERVADRRRLHVAGPAALLPERIELAASGESLVVTHSPPAAGPASARRPAGRVVLSGDPDPAARLAALDRWLTRTARESLGARIHILAARHGLIPRAVRVGRARSRWGSCSGRGTLTVSRNLMFLPPHLVDALILHELAHLRHLDHSPRFHAFLATLDPDAARNRRELRAASVLVPAWAER